MSTSNKPVLISAEEHPFLRDRLFSSYWSLAQDDRGVLNALKTVPKRMDLETFSFNGITGSPRKPVLVNGTAREIYIHEYALPSPLHYDHARNRYWLTQEETMALVCQALCFEYMPLADRACTTGMRVVTKTGLGGVIAMGFSGLLMLLDPNNELEKSGGSELITNFFSWKPPSGAGQNAAKTTPTEELTPEGKRRRAFLELASAMALGGFIGQASSLPSAFSEDERVFYADKKAALILESPMLLHRALNNFSESDDLLPERLKRLEYMEQEFVSARKNTNTRGPGR